MVKSKLIKNIMVVLNIVPIPSLLLGLLLIYFTNSFKEMLVSSFICNLFGIMGLVFLVIYFLSINLTISEIVLMVIEFKKNYTKSFKTICIIFTSINFTVYVLAVHYFLWAGTSV